MKFGSVFMPTLITLFVFYSCEKKIEPIIACMNEFAVNHDLSAEIDCCCEYNVEAIINDVVGSYQFVDYCQHFDYEYQTKISKDVSRDSMIIIENFSVYKQTFSAKFSRGIFMIKDSFYVGGCKFEFEGELKKVSDKLMLESSNTILEGLCNNLTDLECTAIAD